MPQWPIGVYYLILKVDGYNYVFEPNEINNKLAPVTITLGLPDLAPIHLYIMENALVGSPVRVVYTVTNRGNEIAYASWYDHLYLSSNAILDSQDYSLGSWYQNQSITNGFAYTRTNTVSFPQWPDGTYYFILHVDNWDYIFESSEDNNTSVCAVTVSPPLLKNASFELEGSVVSNAAYWESGVPDEHGMRWGSASRVSWRSYDESWEGCIPGTWAGMGTNGGFWQEVPAVAGARYVVSGWFWADQGTYSGSPWTSATKGLKLEFLKGGSPLSGITNSLSGVGETWEEFIVDGAAPVSANWVRVSVFANGVSTNGALQFDNFRLSRFPFDSDEDGLIDEWEFTYYPSLTNTSGNADPDRDGATCWEEWMAGTDPTNNKSFLGMRMPQPSSGSGVYVRWASVTGKVYAVDRSTNLNSTPAFLTLQQQIYGQPGTTVYFDTTSPGLSPRFYRVRIEP